MVMIPCMQDTKRDTDVQNSLLDSVGEGEGGMIWENGIETCKLSYVKQIASPGSMHETGYAGRLNVEYEGNRKLKNDFKILT